MKFALSLIILFSPLLVVAATDIPLEVKVASVDAGKLVDARDTSVARIKALLGSAQSIYSTPKIELADMSAKAQEVARSKGLSVSIAELLDFSLIACETKCSKNQFAESLSAYVTVRLTTDQSHHQATRGLVILGNAIKRLPK